MKKMTPYTPTKFVQDESGSATPLAIGFAVIFIIIGGLAVDFNKAMGERTQMQMATDSAAHAALYTWEFQDPVTARDTAQETIVGMLPFAGFGDALQDTDYAFGFWDPDLNTFTEDPSFVEDKDSPLRSAVQVFAEMEESRSNESNNIFLSVAGHDTFTIRTSSIYASYYPYCLNEGFVAQDVVDLQSGNDYTDGFCIHSNTYVSLNQNNYFEPGTVVSMPNLGDLDIPESGFERNEGLQTALRTGEYRMRLLRQLPMRFASLRSGAAKYAEPGGIASDANVLWPLDLDAANGQGNNPGDPVIQAVLDGNADTIDPTDLLNAPRLSNADSGKKNIEPLSFLPANRIYQLECSGNGDITFSADTFSDFVLVTDCPIQFSNGTVLDNVLIATEGDVDASHVQIGLDDSCDPGGNASIWTYGSVKTASALSGYGAQILALGDIQFTANANGIEGVSFLSLGRIDGTSNSDMGFCDGAGTESFQKAPYFRMVN